MAASRSAQITTCEQKYAFGQRESRCRVGHVRGRHHGAHTTIDATQIPSWHGFTVPPMPLEQMLASTGVARMNGCQFKPCSQPSSLVAHTQAWMAPSSGAMTNFGVGRPRECWTRSPLAHQHRRGYRALFDLVDADQNRVGAGCVGRIGSGGIMNITVTPGLRGRHGVRCFGSGGIMNVAVTPRLRRWHGVRCFGSGGIVNVAVTPRLRRWHGVRCFGRSGIMNVAVTPRLRRWHGIGGFGSGGDQVSAAETEDFKLRHHHLAFRNSGKIGC